MEKRLGVHRAWAMPRVGGGPRTPRGVLCRATLHARTPLTSHVYVCDGASPSDTGTLARTLDST